MNERPLCILASFVPSAAYRLREHASHFMTWMDYLKAIGRQV